jgi:hypothetical protein
MISRGIAPIPASFHKLSPIVDMLDNQVMRDSLVKDLNSRHLKLASSSLEIRRENAPIPWRAKASKAGDSRQGRAGTV